MIGADPAVVVGCVLAGGTSRRMGRDKALVEWQGESLLLRAVRTLESVCEEVVVSSDQRPGYEQVKRPILPDEHADQGPLGGLATVFGRFPGRAVFVLACDLPRVPAELVSFLIEHALTAAGTGPALAVVPALDGRLQPLCGFYSGDCAPLLAAYLERGERRAVEFVEEIGGRCVDLDPELSFYRPDLLYNLNRLETQPVATEAISSEDTR